MEKDANIDISSSIIYIHLSKLEAIKAVNLLSRLCINI